MIDYLMARLRRREALNDAKNSKRSVLQLMVSSAPAAAGGMALLLCDSDGEPLPMQVGVRLNQEPGDATVTVTFFIDGDRVKFA